MTVYQTGREQIAQRYRGPDTPAGMPTVLLGIELDDELYPAVSIVLDDSPTAVPVPEHLWRRHSSDLAALDNTRARIIAIAQQWRREQEALQAGTPDPGRCQVCGQPGGYPACSRPVPGTGVPCTDLWNGQTTNR